MDKPTAFAPDYAVAPGEVIDEHREASDMTQAELAQRLGFSLKHVNRLLAGNEPVTPETALKLEAVFGLPARLWLGLEARYREHLARSADEKQLEAECGWLKQLPYRSLAKLGWVPSGLRGIEQARALRAFFGVGSLDYLPDVWGKVQTAWRKSPAFASHEWSLLAWLTQGEREAEHIACRPFDAAGLRAGLPALKALSRLPGTDFLAPLVQRCAAQGVAVVLLPAPDGARVCGATRWLSKDKVLVQLSLRYRTDDQLWFTLFHELGHVLLHGKREPFIDFKGETDDSAAEAEANAFATRELIAPGELTRFIARGDFSAAAVQAFAEAQQVSPGIVVGQLQHRRVLSFASTLNTLKARLDWTQQPRAA
jgi:HTH-type transcriptional regulator / antitoxin HigA